MTQDKMRRIITACTAAVTTLLVFLLSFLIYQWITIASLNKKIDQTRAEIVRLEKIVEQKKMDVEYFRSEAGLRILYQQLTELEGKK